ncbi:MAG: UDP-N-acetylmuramoyl-L-alanyl-D-glutamate--2,6-diaminopimelate ligase [Pseudomonadota bacterium]
MPPNLISALSKLKICDITAHSKKVSQDSAFFAINGTTLNGNDYIEAAIKNGAKLIVTDKAPSFKIITPFLVVPDAREALAKAARHLYPGRPQYMVAVTGTGGKTSVANYFWQICSFLSEDAAVIGTMGVSCKDHALKNELEECGKILTTPDVVTMHKMLNIMHKHKVEYLAFEASSHGLDQKRLLGIPVVAAALTNITHDHLDYHGTMEAYTNAKLKLFTENLDPGGLAIISTDLENFEEIKEFLLLHKRKYVTIGKKGDLDIRRINSTLAEQKIEFSYKGQIYNFETNIFGGFQASNMLIAALLVEACGLSFEYIMHALPKLQSPRGRLERVTPPDHKFHIFVDYAHKPDALEKSLFELNHLKKNRLLVVFGCGGDRDKEKRPMMGKIASNIADLVIITDDNPRTEDAELIRAQVARGAEGAIEIADREEAIKHAISKMKDGDILLIAGKGHETYQIIGEEKTPFDDAAVVRSYLD